MLQLSGEEGSQHLVDIPTHLGNDFDTGTGKGHVQPV
jgi:hypothetical protein